MKLVIKAEQHVFDGFPIEGTAKILRFRVLLNLCMVLDMVSKKQCTPYMTLKRYLRSVYGGQPGLAAANSLPQFQDTVQLVCSKNLEAVRGAFFVHKCGLIFINWLI